MITCCPKARRAPKDDVRGPSSRGSRRTYVAILLSSRCVVENGCPRTETSLRVRLKAKKTQNVDSKSVRPLDQAHISPNLKNFILQHQVHATTHCLNTCRKR